MIGNSFFYILASTTLLLIFFSTLMGYQYAILKKNNLKLKQNKKEIIGLIDEILFFLPRSAEISKVKKRYNTPDNQEIAIEYINYIIGIYNICGIYCHELHFTKAEIKEHFGNYIAILAEDKTLFNEINRVPGFYKGAEYLLKICR